MPSASNAATSSRPAGIASARSFAAIWRARRVVPPPEASEDLPELERARRVVGDLAQAPLVELAGAARVSREACAPRRLRELARPLVEARGRVELSRRLAEARAVRGAAL